MTFFLLIRGLPKVTFLPEGSFFFFFFFLKLLNCLSWHEKGKTGCDVDSKYILKMQLWCSYVKGFRWMMNRGLFFYLHNQWEGDNSFCWIEDQFYVVFLNLRRKEKDGKEKKGKEMNFTICVLESERKGGKGKERK